MKELIGIVLVALFGVAIWQTRKVATTAPRCPTLDELGAMNDDILDGKTELVDAENLAKSYDAIAGCEAAAASIRATILAKKSATVAPAEAPPLIYKAAPAHVDADLLVAAKPTVPVVGEITDMTIEGLSPADADGNLRMTVRDYAGKPGLDWSDYDRLDFVPALEKRVFRDFAAQGKYREGVTPTIAVTAYNQLHAQRLVADGIALAKTGPGPTPGAVDFGSSGEYGTGHPVSSDAGRW